MDPPGGQLVTVGLQITDADPAINQTASSLDEVSEPVAKLKDGKAPGVCNISAVLLKAGRPAKDRGLHIVLPVVWQHDYSPPNWKRGLVVLIWIRKGNRLDRNN